MQWSSLKAMTPWYAINGKGVRLSWAASVMPIPDEKSGKQKDQRPTHGDLIVLIDVFLSSLLVIIYTFISFIHFQKIPAVHTRSPTTRRAVNRERIESL